MEYYILLYLEEQLILYIYIYILYILSLLKEKNKLHIYIYIYYIVERWNVNPAIANSQAAAYRCR